jgi:hypothetical protein
VSTSVANILPVLYVLDFYCSSLRLAIELDGGQHARPDTLQRDEKRTRWLSERNVTLLRYWNSDVVQNLSGVLEDIAARIAVLRKRDMVSPLYLPLKGGGRRAQRVGWGSFTKMIRTIFSAIIALLTPTRIASGSDLPLSGAGNRAAR